MKNLVISTALVLLSSSSMAQINSKQFVDCFVKATNEVIADLHVNGSKSKKKRLCKELSQEMVDRLIEKFTVIEGGELKYYSADSMGKERMIDIYDYIKDDMSCYGDAVEGQGGSLFGALANSFAYNKNLKLTDMALDKMAGQDLWDKAFSPSIYKNLNDLDLSYCK
ncbi:hypothetical protein ABMA79_01775 [Halobacteriovorax sp. HFRX-2_2]|uniref:hypothetical protein n=1 Tax=unclassified Halobacteriovorax TaxID=2639665 RepID=UPI00371FC9A0